MAGGYMGRAWDIDLSRGKDWLSDVVDTTGPGFDDVLEFDFHDPARFRIEGLTDDPRASLRFQVREVPAFVPSCHGRRGCQSNLPGSPLDAGSVWSVDSWTLEPILTRAAWTDYRQRRYAECYIWLLDCLGAAQVGQGGAPAGWAHFEIVFDLGNPPEDQYLWELILEVGQVALHDLPDRVIPEGQANVAFTLQDVPVGFSSEELRGWVRPHLQEAAPLISERMLGDFARNNGLVDLYLRRGADGGRFLFFVGPDDPRPAGEYGYERPGFFSGPDLLDKVSQTELPGSGDSRHEKLRLRAGETTVWVQDDEGTRYRLRVVVEAARPDEITVYVARRQG